MMNSPSGAAESKIAMIGTECQSKEGENNLRTEPDDNQSNNLILPTPNKGANREQESRTLKELRGILQQCQDYKGNSTGELSEAVENLRVDLGVQVMK